MTISIARPRAVSRSLWSRLIALAAARPVVRELRILGETSDATLAERGLTRDGEFRRILGTRYYF